MSNLVYSIMARVRAFVFDVDGVMTDGRLLITDEGKLLRTFHIRDGYALRKAVERGYPVAIVSGGKSEGVVKRLNQLGITDIFMDAQEKESVLLNWLNARGISGDQLVYMGDDMLDIPAMNHAALRACPSDAVQEVKNISNYISSLPGGAGCVRELIESILKVQNQW